MRKEDYGTGNNEIKYSLSIRATFQGIFDPKYYGKINLLNLNLYENPRFLLNNHKLYIWT